MASWYWLLLLSGYIEENPDMYFIGTFMADLLGLKYRGESQASSIEGLFIESYLHGHNVENPRGYQICYSNTGPRGHRFQASRPAWPNCENPTWPSRPRPASHFQSHTRQAGPCQTGGVFKNF